MSGAAKTRVAILISGRGSNMRSLVEAAGADNYPAEIVAVMSNRPDAPGLTYAREQGIATTVLDHKSYLTRDAFEQDMTTALKAAKIDVIALAGFMRLLTPVFVNAWTNRMINIHPSLLPAFKGLDTHARAIAAGVRIAGCTVHFVRPEMDTGPIIAQAAVPVVSGDTEAALAGRVLDAEHRIYPMALALVASGRTRVEGDKVIISEDLNHSSTLYSPGFDEAR